MDRHEIARMRHGKHELELLLATVAGDVNQATRLVVNIAAELGQAIDDLLNGLLVAGNGSSRDDDGISLMNRKRLMLAVRHARKSGKRLSLRTGAHNEDLTIGYARELIGVDEVFLLNIEIAKLTSNARVRKH